MHLGQMEESLEYFRIYIENIKTTGALSFRMEWIGYALWQNGLIKEAEYYFNEHINYNNRMNELGRIASTQRKLTYYDLARIFAFKGEKDKAYKNLKIFNQRNVMFTRFVTGLIDDPFFNSIRDEPEFQQIVKEVEAKHQAEHERVRQWLEENDLLQ